MKGLALVGFMGAGKTTVGRILARRLGWPFLDLDEELARAGPIAEAIARDGIGRFRAREAELVSELCGDGVARVLAAGGGTFADDTSRAALRSAYRTVWLDAPLAVLEARVGPDDPRRPLWSEGRAARYEERRPAYAEAELRIDTTDRGPEEVADEVIAWLG